METDHGAQWLQFKEILKHVNNFKQMSYRLLVKEFTCLLLDVHLSVFYRTSVIFLAKISILKHFINSAY